MDVDLIYSTVSDLGESAQSCLNERLFIVLFFKSFGIFFCVFPAEQCLIRPEPQCFPPRCLMHVNEGHWEYEGRSRATTRRLPVSWLVGISLLTRTHKSGQLPASLYHSRLLKDKEVPEQKKITLHIFRVVVHCLAPFLQLAVEIDVSQDLLHVFKGRGLGVIGKVKKPGLGWAMSVAPNDITSVFFLHILLWYMDHHVTFGIFNIKQMKLCRMCWLANVFF